MTTLCRLLGNLKKATLLKKKSIFIECERHRDFHPFIHVSNIHNSHRRRQVPGTLSRSPRWVTGTILLEPSYWLPWIIGCWEYWWHWWLNQRGSWYIHKRLELCSQLLTGLVVNIWASELVWMSNCTGSSVARAGIRHLDMGLDHLKWWQNHYSAFSLDAFP